MSNHGLTFSIYRNERDNKIMNKTTYSFPKLKSKNNIQKLSLFEGPSIDYELKYNKINNKYATSTINIHNNNSSSKKSIEKSKRAIYSLKHFNSNIKKKKDHNNFNVLTFNNEICKETNHSLKGKKITVSKYPLFLRNKFENNTINTDKTLKASSLFDKFKNNENVINTLEGQFHKKIFNKKGYYFSTKIDKDLIDILNKNKNSKNNKIESYPVKLIMNNKSFSPLIRNKNKSKFNYLENLGEPFHKRNKMKLIKNKTSSKTLSEVRNKKIKFNYINQNISPKMMARDILYINQYNKIIKRNQALNLLNDEKKYLHKFENLNSYYHDDKGNIINFPLLTQQKSNTTLQNNFDNYDTKFNFDPNIRLTTESGNTQMNEKFDNYKDTQPSTSGGGKLGQLIKDRFTKQNYKNINISKIKNDSYPFKNASHYSHLEHYYNDSTKTNEKTIENFHIHSHYQNKFKNLENKSTFKSNRKEEREKLERDNSKNNDNLLKDILGLINSKVITASINVPNKNKKRRLRRFSCMENPIGNFNLTNKLFGGNLINNSFYSQFIVKDSRKKDIRVLFKKRKNSVLVPINEEGEEIKDMRIINNLLNEAKEKLNTDAQSKIFHKRLSFDAKGNFINPLNKEFEKSSRENSSSSSDSSNNNLDINKSKNVEKDKIVKNKSEKSIKKGKKKIVKKTKIKDKKKQKGKIQKSLNKKNISKIKSNDNNKKGSDDKIEKKESEAIIDPEVNNLLNQIENEDQNNINFYQEEDDFIKDFNFDFYSSEEDEKYTLQKKMRQIRKKKNKCLFLIFKYIAKKLNYKKDFEKADLIKCLIDEEFKFNFMQLKEQVIRDRELSINSGISNDKNDSKKVEVDDMEIINYLFHYIKDKNSLFYKAIYNPSRRKSIDIQLAQQYNKQLNIMIDDSKEEEVKKRRRFSIYQYRPQKKFDEDLEFKVQKKIRIKKERKKGKEKNIHDFITESEKKLLLMNEMNLTNEIRYQISISNDKEIKEKFINLLNKIESLKSLDSNEFAKSFKENYDMYKDEAMEILKAKEIEERLNGFIDSLNYERSNLKEKHKYIMSLLSIKDNKFLSILEKRLNGLK